MSVVVEETNIGTIEITEEDVKNFLPDKVVHITQRSTGRIYCGAQGPKTCCNSSFVVDPNVHTCCIYCGTPLCSFCLLLCEEKER